MCRGIAATLVLTRLGLALADRSYSTGDRAVSGGLLGDGAGTAVGAVTGDALLRGH